MEIYCHSKIQIVFCMVSVFCRAIFIHHLLGIKDNSWCYQMLIVLCICVLQEEKQSVRFVSVLFLYVAMQNASAVRAICQSFGQ